MKEQGKLRQNSTKRYADADPARQLSYPDSEFCAALFQFDLELRICSKSFSALDGVQSIPRLAEAHLAGLYTNLISLFDHSR